MANARKNVLAGRLAEHLVCAELARLGLIATTFTHNIPVYDILATDERCQTVPIQVKATRDRYWRSSATSWMHVDMCKTSKLQIINGLKDLHPLNPIWVCVALGASRLADQFFVLAEADLQSVIFKNYSQELGGYAGRRLKTGKRLIAGGALKILLRSKTDGISSKTGWRPSSVGTYPTGVICDEFGRFNCNTCSNCCTGRFKG
ncbi:hypothetical protein KP001_11950 [Geomonas subterranea]|uniref:DUF4365 domain-containing protein n=1 Tax=Geomonas subterranea TaxID=2847989 RepID=A0ABX8LB06_9BACT|nr:hypothetical protein [Geomonas subterranea]QXE89180.1 hypothetical protein KP001_11950 [Geomonas subterranea]QXM08705.1 hypothetical protein KP002_17325 [Geomonas subterranea]